MDAQFLISLTKLLLGLIVIMVIYNLSLVFKLKKIDPFKNWPAANGINGMLMLLFMIFGFIAATWSSLKWAPMFDLVRDSASEHGKDVDSMFWITMWVSVLVVIVTNSLLFGFAWRYRQRKGKKALYYTHNNKLEVIWTVIPAIVMTLLIARGVKVWHDIMDPDEQKREAAIDIEFYARQFDWSIRYTGEDKKLGQTHVKFIDPNTSNQLGFNFDDPLTHDDIVAQEVHMPVNVPVHMHIRSQDVLHSATLAHFRVKMDAVPGMPTNFWFTPTVTTEEMRAIKKNPEFNYELSCQQICGSSHYNMRRVVIVESMEEYEKWLSEQKPAYQQYLELNGLDAKAQIPSGEEKEVIGQNDDQIQNDISENNSSQEENHKVTGNG